MTRMALSERNLTDGEQVVMELREHPKALAWPVVLLIAVLVAAVAAGVLVPEGPGRWVAWGVLAVVAVVWVLVPWLRWRSTSFTVTNQRIAMRSGITTRIGRDIPLYRINDISMEKDLVDRLFGCGTLVVSDATEKAGMSLPDVPDVEDVHRRLQELLFRADDGSDDGEWPPTEPRRRR
ncbi:PH (Pleckstrin Homology) domain-containing protein [Isoptericola jiangsuensis]|uniref:PH (Pleckstrin Homology) domain-containing protein n=1 Tax=Isoptericola jiangsuensis TaxID=548579 RepID=A0A2A9ETR0_9MICO|nr:PH domain-containing protein [Isoptericola jiangsuensis]PFG41670.1 PH (Pleckstrin Homology) domain-containing protein [Isoptericola jiangsuensis]